MITPSINLVTPHRLRCRQCGDTGKLLAASTDPKINALPYAFRCTCEMGSRSQMAFPRWEPGQSLKYQIIIGIQGATASV